MILNFNSTQLRTSLEYFCLFDLDRNELLSQSVQPDMRVIYSHGSESVHQAGFCPMRYVRFYAETLCMPSACLSLLVPILCAVNKKLILSGESMKV